MSFGEAEPVEVNIIVGRKVSELVGTLYVWIVEYFTEIMKI
jgi:hypothetical protein